jgi:hypothetical protein
MKTYDKIGIVEYSNDLFVVPMKTDDKNGIVEFRLLYKLEYIMNKYERGASFQTRRLSDFVQTPRPS